MASAEARGAHGINCGFVQEDMTRASRSSSSLKSESDGGTGEAVDKSDHPCPGCMPTIPVNWKSSNQNLSPQTNQWPSHQKDFSYESLSSLELEVLSSNFVDQMVKFEGEKLPDMEYHNQSNVKNNADPFQGQQRNISSTYMKNDQGPKIQEIESLLSNNLPKNKDIGEFWYADGHLIDLDTSILASEEPEKLYSDMESYWIEVEKSVPWWRVADKDDLASMVSCMSTEHIRNCDLPQPKTENLVGERSVHLQWFEHSKTVDSSSDQMVDKKVPNRANNARGSPTLASLEGQQCTPGDVGSSSLGSDRPFRPTTLNTTSMDEVETPQRAAVDLSKAQLLEALCHSQTRAREAEKAAQQACDEKERITMLFFREASYLFAYRQWFQILQLENLCLQLKSKDKPTSIHFPVSLPWITSRKRKTRKGRHKVTKKKLPPLEKKTRKRVVAFAVGLSFAGAGLLLGWTVGFLFLAI